jgi:hypothetical protein
VQAQRETNEASGANEASGIITTIAIIATTATIECCAKGFLRRSI